MFQTEEKLSANQRWKKSGTTLPFKEWLKREDDKKASVKSDTNFIPFVSAEKKPISMESEKSLSLIGTEDKSKIFGVSKTALIISGVLIVGSLSFLIYKKIKSKK
jgi:hypothetical protein